MLVSSSEAAAIAHAFISVWLCSQPAAKGIAWLWRTRPGHIRYRPTGRHYSKKKLLVVYNLVYMVILVTVLLSLLEGGGKVCRTFSRSEA